MEPDGLSTKSYSPETEELGKLTFYKTHSLLEGETAAWHQPTSQKVTRVRHKATHMPHTLTSWVPRARGAGSVDDSHPPSPR